MQPLQKLMENNAHGVALEMRMLRWMMEIKRIEKIRNEEIRTTASVANISKRIREARLRWLGHVERKTE